MREQAEAFAKAFKASGVKGVALAGRPGEFERAWRAAGVDDFIFAGGDAVARCSGLYRRIGVESRRSEVMTLMSQIPDFSKVPFAAPPKPIDAGESRIWATPEGIEVKSLYGPRDRDGARPLERVARASRPFCAGPIRRCTSRSPGRCDNTPASRPPRNRTPSIAPISPRVRRACPSPSIWRRIAATTRTIRASRRRRHGGRRDRFDL